MKRDISQVVLRIDNLAQLCCRRLSDDEKEDFFKTTKIKRYYVKGKNKGKERELYDVDGKYFNEIWKLSYPYILTACARSVYYNSLELEEAISEVKFNLFSILQRFGPVFQGKTLSQRLSIIINISLTNNNRRLMRRVETVSMNNFKDDEGQEFDFEDKSDETAIAGFYSDMPKRLKDAIENYVENYIGINSKLKVENHIGINLKLKKEIREFVLNY